MFVENHLKKWPVEKAIEWFSECGRTDSGYLAAHWDRFLKTFAFAMHGVEDGARLNVLDVGCHWLHNALLYGDAGHDLICIDAPNVFRHDSVLAAGKRLNATLIPSRRMETGDGLEQVADDSVDLVLFCEIIEHLAFNPIPFWKQVYRVLRPGGRIIITTPNALYHRSIDQQMKRLVSGVGAYGPTVHDIMTTGTYGHHWKEFSLSELKAYFAFMSTDFDTSRHEMITLERDMNVKLSQTAIAASAFADVHAHNIYLEVVLKEKSAGIQVSPPWIPV
jgi:2-polyprenyl-6-hydroxyphenyl methylase/3-demethylubiquinone-9 3-methyltransferase